MGQVLSLKGDLEGRRNSPRSTADRSTPGADMGRAVNLHEGKPDISQHEAAGPPLRGLGHPR